MNFSGIERHADDGINSERVEGIDFPLLGDAAGDHQMPLRCASYGMNRIHRDATHQTLGVDVRIEETLAERFQFANHVEGGDGSLSAPPVNRNPPASRIEREHECRPRERACYRACVLLVDSAFGQQCRTDDDLARTYV